MSQYDAHKDVKHVSFPDAETARLEFEEDGFEHMLDTNDRELRYSLVKADSDFETEVEIAKDGTAVVTTWWWG